ncbi:MAG: hypothetical protein EA402_11655 [Planctomycetota bacterium]|nr:MAG: hypothetical protein EA402_11655 [Planctomycetota bacterium]
MLPTPWHPQLVIGCMSGTSCDGIDAVAVSWAAGRPRAIAARSLDLGALGNELYGITQGQARPVAQLCALIHELSEAHCRVLAELIAELPQVPELICVHGQTLYHAPPHSWQAINMSLIAERFALPVVGDLRAADLAQGGQGAPLSPLGDLQLYPGSGRRAVINLGGFCNITILDHDQVAAGYDLCAANHLLNAAARSWLGLPFDRDGAVAAQGQPDAAAVADLQQRLAAQSQGRSLGSGDEALAWVERWRPQLGPAVALASIQAALSQVLIRNLQGRGVGQAWLAGGGALNLSLLSRLRRAAAAQGISLESSEAAGLPPMWREGAIMAILGRRCAQGLPITLSAVTGCRRAPAVSGIWAWPRPQAGEDGQP